MARLSSFSLTHIGDPAMLTGTMDRKNRQGVHRVNPNRLGPKEHHSALHLPPAQHYEIQSLRLAQKPSRSTEVLLSRKKLQHNAAVIRSVIGEKTRLCAVVKANAYGHGARLITAALNHTVDYFAVAGFDEAEEIFPFAQGKPILIMTPLYSGMDPHWLRVAQLKGYHCTICSTPALADLMNKLPGSRHRLKVQLKIDTGMGRCGLVAGEALDVCQKLLQEERLHLTGVYTHFACAEQADHPLTKNQLNAFGNFLTRSSLLHHPGVCKHACNSMATLTLPQAHFDMVRCGLGLYGYMNSQTRSSLALQPVMKVQAPLVQIKTLRKGQPSGYDASFIAPGDMIIGIIPIGYADGLPRAFSNRIRLRFGAEAVPVVGRISMNFTVLDFSHVKEPKEGDWVTLMDDQPDSPCSVSTLARTADTINYEILTNLSRHLKRVMVD